MFWPLLEAISRDLDPQVRAVALPVNVFRTENEVVVTAEVPGVEPGDLDVTVKDRVLTLTAERKPVELAEEEVFLSRERRAGRLTRAIRLPFEVNAEAITAQQRNGVLKVTLPRSEASRPRTIPIQND